MEAGITEPAFAVPGAMDALQSVGAAIAATGIDPKLVQLINIRASQVNGCAVCLEGHVRHAQEAGETIER
jgi:AhpD family alkylhydroperoxidase